MNRLKLFPISTRILQQHSQSVLSIDGIDLTALTEQYGTPLYLYDQNTLDHAVNEYRQGLQDYPFKSGITYAGKAFLCTAIAQWAITRGLWIDATGSVELEIASRARVPREQILVHGVNKSHEDLWKAFTQAGTLVVDNLRELHNLIELFHDAPASIPQIWLRFRPGFVVDTHSYRQTGQQNAKFGMNEAELFEAVEICLTSGLNLTGLHFHLGSHFYDPSPLEPAIKSTVTVMSSLKNKYQWTPQFFCPGGGWGVAYHEDELPSPSISDYVHFISQCLVTECNRNGLPLPHLQLEPGRSLVAQAGVAIYRVGAVKQTGDRRWLLLDGGMADNPRPALYGAKYSALPLINPERLCLDPAWLAGPYCESGDILISGLPMPEIEENEFVAIPVSGAYQVSMSSNYNGARRPAIIWLNEGKSQLIRRRENIEDLLARDFPLDQSSIGN